MPESTPAVCGDMLPAEPKSGSSLDFLFAPVDGASIVLFRVAFSVLLLWELFDYAVFGQLEGSWVEPDFYFTYPGFGWVTPWPGDGMYYHFFGLLVCLFCMAMGFCYRLAATGFFLGFAYVFLLCKGHYLNHFYLFVLLAFLLAIIPANRQFSVDALLRPQLRSTTVPRWCVWILRLQLSVVYFFGGVAKINGDWLRGVPLTEWVHDEKIPLLELFIPAESMGVVMSYGGLALDLFCAPFLLWRPTRWLSFSALLLFHYINSSLFPIGIFPIMTVAATTVFFEPDWPRKLAARVAKLTPITLGLVKGIWNAPSTILSALGRQAWARWAFVGVLATYALAQMFVPLRHLMYPGHVHWTEEGHRFSWRMMLRSKDAETAFRVVHPATGKTWEVDPDDYLTERQSEEMQSRPDMILQFAHILRDDFGQSGFRDVEVYADAMVSLNGRPHARLIDPNVDLAAQEFSPRPSPWILPLSDPPTMPWRRRVSASSALAGR